jgi:hypothetical protein
MTETVGFLPLPVFASSLYITSGNFPKANGHRTIMRINLIPREKRFFDTFDEAAAILTRAAGKCLAMVKE